MSIPVAMFAPPNAQVRDMPLAYANALVARWHRHSKPVQFHRFSLGLIGPDGEWHGAAIVGRPVASVWVDPPAGEVTRLVTDGTPNACSQLYAACVREARRRGWAGRLITYTLATEPGTSLVAAGWQREGTVRGHQWSHPSRPRALRETTPDRVRWSCPIARGPRLIGEGE